MVNSTTRRAATALAAWMLGLGLTPGAQAATLEMRVDGGFVTGTLIGLQGGESLSFEASGSFASGGSALVSLTTDLVMGLSGRLLLRTPAQFNPAAFASWEQYAVSGVVGLGTSAEINLNVVTTPGPYRRSTLIANGTLLQSVDVLGATVSAVPEPTTWALMLAGLAGLKGLVRRSQRTRGRQDACIPTPDDPARCRANAGKHRADNG